MFTVRKKLIKSVSVLTVRDFYIGAVAPLTPGAMIKSTAHLDHIYHPRTDAVQAEVCLCSRHVLLQSKKKPILLAVSLYAAFYHIKAAIVVAVTFSPNWINKENSFTVYQEEKQCSKKCLLHHGMWSKQLKLMWTL